MSVVDAAGRLGGFGAHPSIFPLQVLPNGRIVAVYAHATTGAMEYASSSDGITWNTPTAMPGTVAIETVRGMYLVGYRLVVFVMLSQEVHAVGYDYNATTNTFTVAYTSLVAALSGAQTWTAMDVAQIGSTFHVVMLATTGITQPFRITTFSDTDQLTAQGTVIPYSTPPGSSLVVRVTTGAVVHVLAYNDGAYVDIVISYAAGYLGLTNIYTMIAAERVQVLSTDTATPTMVIEADGTISAFFLIEGAVYVRRRQSANLWSDAVMVANAVASDGIQPVTDAATGDLLAYYISLANSGAAGELYIAQRHLGAWSLGKRLDGGDAVARRYPRASPVTTSGVAGVLYEETGAGVLYLGQSISGPPAAPTLLSPTGAITSLSPVFVSTYNQLATADPMSAYQLQVTRVSDGHVRWDSGSVSGASVSVPYGSVGATAEMLVYDEQYQWRRRDKDTTSAGGAGTWSPWSAMLPFIAHRGGAVTITSVTHDSTTDTASPSALASPSLSVLLGWTQLDGHNGSKVEAILYDSDATSILQIVDVSPATPVPAGGTVTVMPSLSLANAHSYYLAFRITDQVTNVVTLSAQWRLNTAWTAPGAATALTFTDMPDNFCVRLTWVNSVGTSAVEVAMQEKSPSGRLGPWEIQYPAAGPITQIDLFPKPQLRYTYRVRLLGANGLPSSDVLSVDQRHRLAANRLGVTLVSPSDPSQRVGLGILEGATTGKFSRQEDVAAVVPLGDTVEESIWSPVEFDINDQLAFMIPAYIKSQVTGAEFWGYDVVRDLLALHARHETLLWRDPSGHRLFVSLHSVTHDRDMGGNWHVTFAIREAGYDGPEVVVPGP